MFGFNNNNNVLHRRNKTLFYEFKSFAQPSSPKQILFETQPHFQCKNIPPLVINNNNVKVPKIEKLCSINSNNEHNSTSSTKNSTFNNLGDRLCKYKSTFETNKIVFTTDSNTMNNSTQLRLLEKIEKNPESIFSKAKKISNKY